MNSLEKRAFLIFSKSASYRGTLKCLDIHHPCLHVEAVSDELDVLVFNDLHEAFEGFCLFLRFLYGHYECVAVK